jgi:hypothetical protein
MSPNVTKHHCLHNHLNDESLPGHELSISRPKTGDIRPFWQSGGWVHIMSQ